MKYEDVDDDRSHPYERGQNRNSSDWGDWNASEKRPDSSNRRWEEGQNSSSSTARNVSEDDSWGNWGAGRTKNKITSGQVADRNHDWDYNNYDSTMVPLVPTKTPPPPPAARRHGDVRERIKEETSSSSSVSVSPSPTNPPNEESLDVWGMIDKKPLKEEQSLFLSLAAQMMFL